MAIIVAFSCVQCRNDCDCPTGTSCQNYFNNSAANIATWGQCISHSSILGKTCDASLSTGSQSSLKYGSMSPYRGCFFVVSENSVGGSAPCSNPVCYHALTNGAGGAFACISGTCQECDSRFILDDANALTEISVTQQALQMAVCTGGASAPKICKSNKWKSYNAASGIHSPSFLVVACLAMLSSLLSSVL